MENERKNGMRGSVVGICGWIEWKVELLIAVSGRKDVMRGEVKEGQ